MTPFLSYMLKANLALVLLYGFYYLCLRRDTFYGHIRWYLLVALAATALFPLTDLTGWLTRTPVVTASQQASDTSVLYQYILALAQMEPAPEPAAVSKTPVGFILWWCWLPVALFLLGKRLFQLTGILVLYVRYPGQFHGVQAIVAINRNIQPFSFFNHIFLNPSRYTNEELDEIVAHEQVHCRHAHTVDILLAEMAVCLCWFNPVAWLLRSDLKQNLEYYTDRKTLRKGFNRKHYQYNLLRVSGGAYQIVNHFHFNHLKKRIIMMNKKDSPRILAVKYLLAIPAFMAALMAVQASGLQAAEEYSHGSVTNPAGVDTKETDTTTRLAENLLSDLSGADGVHVRVGKAGENVQVSFNDGKETIVCSVMGTVITNSTDVPDSTKKVSVVTIDGKNLMDTNPLIFVDGKEVPKTTMNTIDSTTIESISVLKDQTTIDKYGDKAKDGVIIITTKGKAPLIILDGKEVPNATMNTIDPNTIESITVLKDHSATALYGDKAKNGVVLITTKTDKGEKNESPGKIETIPDYHQRQGTTPVADNNTASLTSGDLQVDIANMPIDLFDNVVNVKEGKHGTILVTTRRNNNLSGANMEKPLYIVDGLEVSSLNVSPYDIESVSVLKDKSATTIYGDKAKNGVIMVKTKKQKTF